MYEPDRQLPAGVRFASIARRREFTDSNSGADYCDACSDFLLLNILIAFASILYLHLVIVIL